ncbi:fungal-specific transcription factor domain-containing protein [Hypoxylon trugodes]|uniref:fungal-specific transcription factor domain-containing protein n=1 Tax=Hypoxylon trugodes TaxID=326681 RepID=UPI002194A469|nr:fungal-specific transcription factor domain-containing protein [Hypoxylon trugodes]KAI1383885.1 fungal-specific transcription factor domain-containing protein [Hypoxylon trugodes]
MNLQPTANVASRSAPQQQSKPLSCTNCRARKLKCSREHPCTHCVRSGAECIFPARKRTRKPRKNKNSELLQRLSRLETIVGNVGLAGLVSGDDTTASNPASTSTSVPAPNPSAALPAPPKQIPVPETQDDGQKALQESKASQYLSGQFWSSLCGEVEGLRQALEQSTDSDDDDSQQQQSQQQQPLQEATPDSIYDNSGSSTSGLSPGMLLGGTPRLSSEQIEHPPPDQIRFLTTTYFTNVDMILKILHRPTIEPSLHLLANSLESPRYQPPPTLMPEREALIFSIYHAAVASLSPATCLSRLGRRRMDLLRIYAAAVERFLVRANYLDSTSLETLQALTLYAACVRSSGGSRAAWALLALPIRLAQALGLHREAGNARLSSYEAELRRRLWWQLIVLDIRAAEDRGTTTVIARGSYDTRMPLNIDDADFGPETRAALTEKKGPTDITFNLCTAHSSNIFLYVEHAQDAVGVDDGSGGTEGGVARSSNIGGSARPPPQSVEETVRHAQSLESQFVSDADPNHAPSYFASVMAHLVTLKLWLIMQYPLHPRRRRQPSQTSPALRQNIGGAGIGAGSGIFPNEATLRTALSIMELNEHLQTGPFGERFRWWADTYVQWHPLAVALAELCTQTRGELVDRAWRTIDDIFPRWSEVIADTKNGTLWRPIRKLYKKAKAARNAATAALTSTATVTAPTTSTATVTTVTDMDTAMTTGDTPQVSRPQEGWQNPVTVTATATMEPESAYSADIRNARESSVPPDIAKLSMSPYGLNESMWGWRDLSFDIPLMDLGGGSNMMDWSTWDDFVTETQADDGRSKSGSSEMSS